MPVPKKGIKEESNQANHEREQQGTYIRRRLYLQRVKVNSYQGLLISE